MNTIRPYQLFILALLPLLIACGGKKINNRVSLWRNDKIPYGCWYAYNELEHIFPEAKVVVNKLSPDRFRKFRGENISAYEEAIENDNQKSLYMIVAREVVPDKEEVDALLSLAGQGKHVFISTMQVGKILLDSLQLKTAYSHSANNFYDSLTVSVTKPVSGDSIVYSYPGRALDNFILEMDSNITNVIGKDKYGRPNFVRFDYEGGGSIYLHLAPMALTNYFLLHKENKGYYDHALSHVPKDIEVVQWDDYFRYHERDNGRNGGSFSALGWISKQPGLSAALWLVIILFLIIYLFDSKRKQRVIPEQPPLKNASLDFVKTIGRLYYQRRDNRNLAHKMTAHFLDHVRGKYNIRVSINDDEFEKRLAWKTGADATLIRDLVHHIKYVQSEYTVSDQALMELNTRLENFYRANA